MHGDSIYETAKKAEIMSKYRPIAPKPEGNSVTIYAGQSPYLRDVRPNMQAKATRMRKPPVFKGRRSHLTSPPKTFSLEGFTHGPAVIRSSQTHATTTPSTRITLSLLPNTSFTEPLNSVANKKNLFHELQRPIISSVIKPEPIRPVDSTITVICICQEYPNSAPAVYHPDNPNEIESESMPAIISDSRNKVRKANSAYKKMIGQPECLWLDLAGAGSCKRINGEVKLQFCNSWVPIDSSNRFTCRVRIEWANYGRNNSINAFCEAVKLCCEEKDYLFAWRFHK